MNDGYHASDEIQGKVFDRRLLGLLWPYARRHRLLGIGSLAAVLATTGLQVTGPYLVRLTIDEAILKSDARLLLWFGGIFLALQIARFATSAVFSYGLQKLGQLVVHDLRCDLFRHLESLPAPFFDRNPVGRLVTRLTNDVESITEIFRGGVVVAISDLLLIAGISVMLFVLDVRLALLTLILYPFMLLAVSQFARRLRLAFRRVRQRLARINAFLAESIGGMAVIQLFNREGRSLERFHEITADHFRAQFRSLRYWAMFSSSIVLFSAATTGILLYAGGGRVLAGAISLGTFVAYLAYVAQLFEPIRDMTERYNEYLSATASLERIYGLLQEKPEGSAAETVDLPRPRGEIEFRRVWFEYKPGEPVLRDVSFHIQPGETVAIVGATGSGKTTLLNLLTKFYEVTAGEILIDGLELAAIRRGSLRRHIGIIPQEITLFAGPLRDNVTLWNPEIPAERVEEISRHLHSDRFIRRLPQGYDTELEEAGHNLSVGEKQLLSFARVLAYDPAVLILDEATSNIDSQTECLIQEAIRAVTAGRTSIVVAHRLSTIRQASRILVLHKGRLVEQGTHASLLAENGVYARLYRLQFAHREPAAGAAPPPELGCEP